MNTYEIQLKEYYINYYILTSQMYFLLYNYVSYEKYYNKQFI